jgi:hypothetical protein
MKDERRVVRNPPNKEYIKLIKDIRKKVCVEPKSEQCRKIKLLQSNNNENGYCNEDNNIKMCQSELKEICKSSRVNCKLKFDNTQSMSVSAKPKTVSTRVSAKSPKAGMSSSRVSAKQPKAGMSSSRVSAKQPKAGMSSSRVSAKPPKAGMSSSRVSAKPPKADMSSSRVSAKPPKAGMSSSRVSAKPPKAGMSSSRVLAKPPKAGMSSRVSAKPTLDILSMKKIVNDFFKEYKMYHVKKHMSEDALRDYREIIRKKNELSGFQKDCKMNLHTCLSNIVQDIAKFKKYL